MTAGKCAVNAGQKQSCHAPLAVLVIHRHLHAKRPHRQHLEFVLVALDRVVARLDLRFEATETGV